VGRDSGVESGRRLGCRGRGSLYSGLGGVSDGEEGGGNWGMGIGNGGLGGEGNRYHFRSFVDTNLNLMVRFVVLVGVAVVAWVC
jgi:hypothetical protein